MKKIMDAHDRAYDQGYRSYQEYLEKLPAQRPQLKYKAWNGQINQADDGLRAYINGGRWLVRCHCNNISVVTPRWPFHWCLVCGNAQSGQAAIPVHFPSEPERHAIEKALLARPIQLSKNSQEMMAVVDAYPLIPGLRRDWYPGQTVEFLLKLNEANGLP